MKTPTGNRNLDKLILAIGIMVAIIAVLGTSSGDGQFGTSLKANVANSVAAESNETVSKTNTCEYIDGRLTIN